MIPLAIVAGLAVAATFGTTYLYLERSRRTDELLERLLTTQQDALSKATERIQDPFGVALANRPPVSADVEATVADADEEWMKNPDATIAWPDDVFFADVDVEAT